MHTEPRSTKRLRNLVVATNLGVLGATGLTLWGWLPNLTGLTLAMLGNVMLGFAQMVYLLSNFFAWGARQNENAALWNLLAASALVFLVVAAWRTWGSYGPGGQAILVLLTTLSLLARILPGIQEESS